MLVYRYDEVTKEFQNQEEAYIDPLETELAGHDVFLLPANCTYNEPLKEKEGFKVKWNGEEWVYEEIPVEPEPPEPTEEEIKQRRIQELESYLYSTDWYAVRYAETGVEIPEEIRIKRQKARDEISALRDEIRSEEESANIEQITEEPVVENTTTEEPANIEQITEEPVVENTTVLEDTVVEDTVTDKTVEDTVVENTTVLEDTVVEDISIEEPIVEDTTVVEQVSTELIEPTTKEQSIEDIAVEDTVVNATIEEVISN